MTAAGGERYASYPSLRGKVVFLSGGSTGLGADFVTQLAAQGAAVGFVDVDVPAGEALAGQLAGSAVPPLFLPADVRDVDALRAAIAEVAARLGPITVLVNNAADDERHALADVEPDYWDASLAVNLRHHFFAAQAVVPGMRAAGGGSIVNLGSVTTRAQFVGMPGYITAKAGIEGLTHTLARELGPDRIRVNCLLPGWVMTQRQLRGRLGPGADRMIEDNQCLPDRLVPPDVTRLLLWLAADDSSAVTAQNLHVNGGWL